jgi:hypothetical protein
LEPSGRRSGARRDVYGGGSGLAALAAAVALAGCGPASPLSGTDRFEQSVKRELNSQLDRGGPFSNAVDVRCIRGRRTFRCDTDLIVDASFFRARYRGRFGPAGCWTAAPVAVQRVAGRRATAAPVSSLSGCVR